MTNRTLQALTLSLSALALAASASAATPAASNHPTVVLVHGAFADSSSWNSVASELREKGYPVVAVANPLRGVASDSRYAASVIDGIQGPIVLVGHSYGGAIISNAAVGKAQVKALVYVAAFAPEKGESVVELAGKFPGSTLGDALAQPVPLPDGGVDLYIQQDKFRGQFAADVGAKEAGLMAVGQRPIAEAALKEANQGTAWKSIPSYFVYGTGDKNIPKAALAWMAERAQSKGTFEIANASHVPMVSHAHEVTRVIETAARSVR